MPTKMSSFFVFLSCVLLLFAGQTSCVKRNLINFQVYEEENVLKSELFVESLVDLSSQLRGSVRNASADPKVADLPNAQNPTQELFDLTVDVRSPIPMKIDGQLSKIELRAHRKASVEQQNVTGESVDKLTLYKLKLNVGELYKMKLNLNHTVRQDGSDEFSTDLDWDPAQSEFAGIYRGILRLHEDRCPRLTLYHNFTTTNLENLIRFASNVTEECQLTNSRNEREDQMKITIDFSTLINDLFDFKLDQLFVRQANKGSETMTLLSKLYKVTVVGQYDNANANETTPDGLKYQFYKRAIFESSMPSQFPSFQIKYSNDQNKNKVKLSFESRDESRDDRRPTKTRDERKDARNGKRHEL